MKRYLCIVAGTLSLTLGIVGIFVPLLPTTPFLLMAAALYLRSSRKLYHWLMSHRYLGEYIRNYMEYKAIPLSTKIATLLLLWIVILCSALFVTDSIYVRVVLLLVAVGVTWHVLSYKTLPQKRNIRDDENKVSRN